MPEILTDANFENTIAKGKWLVDFYADWCGPCKALGPVIEELAGEFEGKIKVGKLNIDDNSATAEKFGVMSIPTLMFFEGGKKISEPLVGSRRKDSLEEEIKKVFRI